MKDDEEFKKALATMLFLKSSLFLHGRNSKLMLCLPTGKLIKLKQLKK